MSEWEEFFKMAGQYYVAGRYAAFAGFIPVTGNLLHHAVEMYLKGSLSKNGTNLNDLRKLGHDLIKIWENFKAVFNAPALTKFDDTIAALELFEDIRYPDLIVAKGMLGRINITKQPQLNQHTGSEPEYDLCVNDIDELVGQIFSTVSANPSAFLTMRMHKEEAKKYLREQNPVSSLARQ